MKNLITILAVFLAINTFGQSLSVSNTTSTTTYRIDKIRYNYPNDYLQVGYVKTIALKNDTIRKYEVKIMKFDKAKLDFIKIAFYDSLKVDYKIIDTKIIK